ISRPRSDQRPGRRPRGPELGVRDGGDQLRAFLPHPPDVVLGDVQVVGILDRPRTRADDRQRPLGHDDVAVAGPVHPVQHHVAHGAAPGEHHAGGGATPGEGTIGPSPPAIRAIFSDHGPVAFTTTSALISPSVPVTWSRTAAPGTAPPCTTRPTTSMNLYSCAPGTFPVAKNGGGT